MQPRLSLGETERPGICQEHRRVPDPSFQGIGNNCYGELWQCIQCRRWVCAGYGAADEQPDKCDSCFDTREEIT